MIRMPIAAIQLPTTRMATFCQGDFRDTAMAAKMATRVMPVTTTPGTKRYIATDEDVYLDPQTGTSDPASNGFPCSADHTLHCSGQAKLMAKRKGGSDATVEATAFVRDETSE